MIADMTRNQNFAYDDTGRLTAASGAYGAYSYSYDLAGNRIAHSRPGINESHTIALSSNRLQQISGGITRSFTYDAAGNAANDNRGPGANYVYTHDAAGDMAQADRDGLTLARYTSDARRLRVVRDLPGAGVPKTHFIYDADGQLLAEHDGTSGAVLREVIWLPLQEQAQSALPIGWVDAAASGAPLYMVHADHLNRPQKLSDATGAVVWDAVSGPFGEPHSITGILAQNLRFPGQYADSETLLSYNWNRSYDPQLGRYLQSDPIGLEGGINTYAYVEGNPVRYTDPSGLVIDTLADLGFIGYDFYRLLQDGACNLSDNLAALGLDAAGAIIPGITGLGAASRAGKAFTKAGKQVIKEKNAAKNAGKMKCENCSQDVVPGKQHQKGVTPPENEAHVDHIQPKSKGGAGSPENGRVLCRSCNLSKRNR